MTSPILKTLTKTLTLHSATRCQVNVSKECRHTWTSQHILDHLQKNVPVSALSHHPFSLEPIHTYSHSSTELSWLSYQRCTSLLPKPMSSLSPISLLPSSTWQTSSRSDRSSPDFQDTTHLVFLLTAPFVPRSCFNSLNGPILYRGVK